jgi:TRAP-type C4-dicarboxylate transport system permease small subunit
MNGSSGKVLSALGVFERGMCALGFLIMTLALAADVGARLLSRAVAQAAGAGLIDAGLADRISLGGGILGAPQVAVIGMIMTALFGMGVAAGQGAELRARLLDGVWPKRWSPLIDRLADGLSAAMLSIVALLCALMAHESLQLGDRSAVLLLPIWPWQGLAAVAFGAAALRYGLYAAQPALRPKTEGAPEAPPQGAVER